MTLDKKLSNFKLNIWEIPAWPEHRVCFPTNDKGLYAVYSERDGKPFYVEPEDIPKYPWIGINSFQIVTDTSPDDELFEDRYAGINNKGVALIVFEFSLADFSDKLIKPRPTLTCQFEDIVHCIYRLKKFMPKRPTKISKWYFGNVVELMQVKTQGRYVFNKPIINPFTSQTLILDETECRITLADLRNAFTLSKEEEKILREKGLRRKAEAGRRSAKKVKKKSLIKIIDAIKKIKAEGLILNQSNVANQAGLSRRTVIRHWGQEEIQKLL
jgi:hypothetical protein